MTISSSLNAGVAGLNANAARLASISDNIANSGTYGYKRAEADFFQMVNAGSNAGTYSAGGVRTSTMRLIDERGALVGTSNATDIAINGRGFLPVSANGAMALTTTGSFRPDANGVLTTDSGLVLMGWAANPDGSIPSLPRESLAALVPVTVNANEFVSNPTTAMTMSANLPATATAAGSTTAPITQTMEYFDNLGSSQSLHVTFTPTVPATGASNEWRIQITDGVSQTVVGEYVMTFDDSQAAGGTLASVTTVSGGAYDPTKGSMAITLPSGPVNFTIGMPGKTNGMTQLSNTYAPTNIEKNGSTVGSLQSVEIDQEGRVHALYDQGFSRIIFQVPVVDVPNPNGLKSLQNQTFQITPEAGAFYLWNAGEGPTGTTEGFTREESTTDVASELTHLIQTQHAYSSNAKIIQTVDQMLQETTNLKR